VITTKAERLRAVYVDLAIGLSLPLLQMILQIIVEGHRFDILEEIGCEPNYYNVTLAYPISFIWPPVLLTISLVYGVLNMRLFWRSSQMFNGLPGSNQNPNQSRYNRLIALSAVEILGSLPVSLYTLYANAYYIPVQPWISWENTHYHYFAVDQVSSAEWHADATSGAMLEVNRWIPVIAAFLFFLFFGFAEEARRHYRKAYSHASSSLRLPALRTGKSGASGSSPPYTPSSSFGHSFKRGMATFSSFKDGFSTLGSSRSKSETTITERKDSFLVSEYRLTSNSSIFEGVDNPEKALEISPPGDDDSKLAPAPASRSAIEALAAVSNLPVPPPPIARVSICSLPPGLYPAFPHSPTSSDLYFDPAEAV
jgi:pheromone a factor receptor